VSLCLGGKSAESGKHPTKGASKMKQSLAIGIIGDFDPRLNYHKGTTDALAHAANALSVTVDCSWLTTQSLEDADSVAALKKFDALWCAPGSPYKSMDGALRGIQFARENDVPFFGT
jgi:CTP synthase (UTP-ammonia lyase)